MKPVESHFTLSRQCGTIRVMIHEKITIFVSIAIIVSIVLIFILPRLSCNLNLSVTTGSVRDKSTVSENMPMENSHNTYKIMKDVGEAYMDRFGLNDADFTLLRDARFTIIEGNFDMCASEEDVRYFLDKSYEYGLKVILPAGSGEAEWGYECDKESYPKTQKPIWNKTAVTRWINLWNDHPALFGWDSSNEAGGNFPNPTPENMLTVAQLQQAYSDIKMADPIHPVIIRINGWYFYDYETDFFRNGNPFADNIADVVMVNAYSNVDEYFPDFVGTVADRSIRSIGRYSPKAQVFIALGVWSEPPLWRTPSIENLTNDINQLNNRTDITGIAYFKYGAAGSEWYMPDKTIGNPEIWDFIALRNQEGK